MAAVTLTPAARQAPSGGARAWQEAPPPGRGGGAGWRSDRWAGGRAGVRGVSATPPRRRRRMSQRLPGEQQAAPPGQVAVGRGSARLGGGPRHGTVAAVPRRDRRGPRAGRSVLSGGSCPLASERERPRWRLRPGCGGAGGRGRRQPPPHGPPAERPLRPPQRNPFVLWAGRDKNGSSSRSPQLVCPPPPKRKGRGGGEYTACLHSV